MYSKTNQKKRIRSCRRKGSRSLFGWITSWEGGLSILPSFIARDWHPRFALINSSSAAPEKKKSNGIESARNNIPIIPMCGDVAAGGVDAAIKVTIECEILSLDFSLTGAAGAAAIIQARRQQDEWM